MPTGLQGEVGGSDMSMLLLGGAADDRARRHLESPLPAPPNEDEFGCRGAVEALARGAAELRVDLAAVRLALRLRLRLRELRPCEADLAANTPGTRPPAAFLTGEVKSQSTGSQSTASQSSTTGSQQLAPGDAGRLADLDAVPRELRL